MCFLCGPTRVGVLRLRLSGFDIRISKCSARRRAALRVVNFVAGASSGSVEEIAFRCDWKPRPSTTPLAVDYLLPALNSSWLWTPSSRLSTLSASPGHGKAPPLWLWTISSLLLALPGSGLLALDSRLFLQAPAHGQAPPLWLWTISSLLLALPQLPALSSSWLWTPSSRLSTLSFPTRQTVFASPLHPAA